MHVLNSIKNGNVRDLKYVSIYIKTMKKAGKYARPIGFRAKNSLWLCNVFIHIFYQ